MSTYAFRDAAGDITLMAPGLARPIPAHAQTPEALDAVETVRREGRAARLTRDVETIVTVHGRPSVARYRGGVPANAHKLEAAARAAGFETMVVELVDGCRVEGHHPQRRVGFTATWIRGRAKGASWHEPRRYAIVHDPRPVGVNALTRTALAGKRAAGVGEMRLALVASPSGFPISHTEVTERINV